MSNCKWTQGEWRVVDRITNGVKGYEICWSDDGEAVTDHVYEEADAHLMSAAKELYKALEAIAKGEGLPPGQTIEGVLAKARGEQ